MCTVALCACTDESLYLRQDYNMVIVQLAQMTCPWVWTETQSRPCFLPILSTIAVIVQKLYQNVHCCIVHAQQPVVVFDAWSWHGASSTGSNKLLLGTNGDTIKSLLFANFEFKSYTKMCTVALCAHNDQSLYLMLDHDMVLVLLAQINCHWVWTGTQSRHCFLPILSTIAVIVEKLYQNAHWCMCATTPTF